MSNARKVRVEKAEEPPVSAEANLGDQLKAMFDTIACGPMPERLTALVDELERRRAQWPSDRRH